MAARGFVGKIVQIQPVPIMYVAVEGIGVPMMTHETQGLISDLASLRPAAKPSPEDG